MIARGGEPQPTPIPSAEYIPGVDLRLDRIVERVSADSGQMRLSSRVVSFNLLAVGIEEASDILGDLERTDAAGNTPMNDMRDETRHLNRVVREAEEHLPNHPDIEPNRELRDVANIALHLVFMHRVVQLDGLGTPDRDFITKTARQKILDTTRQPHTDKFLAGLETVLVS